MWSPSSGTGRPTCTRSADCLRLPLVLGLFASLLLSVRDAGAQFASEGQGTASPAVQSFLARRNQVTLDASLLSASLAYARQVSPGRFLGAEVGVGGDFIHAMLLAGRHFSEDWGLSYERKDGPGDEFLFEVFHVGAFYRIQPSERWNVDVGGRISGFLHYDDSDDDPGGGAFYGAFAEAMYGWRYLKFGPRVLVGVFTEGRPEFGIYLAPLNGRLTFAW